MGTFDAVFIQHQCVHTSIGSITALRMCQRSEESFTKCCRVGEGKLAQRPAWLRHNPGKCSVIAIYRESVEPMTDRMLIEDGLRSAHVREHTVCV
jgi:hypothetical protein